MSREELVDWSAQVVARIAELRELNPNSVDVLYPLSKYSQMLADVLIDPEATNEAIADVVRRTKAEFKTWVGMPAAELVWLSRHVEHWLENR